jgi:hypothetical protein
MRICPTTLSKRSKMQALGKSNLPGFSRGSSSRKTEAKDKVAAAAPENKDSNFDPLKDVTKSQKNGSYPCYSA